VPFVNVYLLFKLAGKPIWWILLLFIPIVNLFIYIMVWMSIAVKNKKSEILGILMAIPLINLYVLWHITFYQIKK